MEPFTIIVRRCEDGAVSVNANGAELSLCTIALLKDALLCTEAARERAIQYPDDPRRPGIYPTEPA